MEDMNLTIEQQQEIDNLIDEYHEAERFGDIYSMNAIDRYITTKFNICMGW